MGKKVTILLMNTSFNLKRTYHSFERNNCTFSSFATLMYFFSPTDQQSNNHLGWPVSTISFSDFSPLTFFLECSNLTNINHQAVGCLLLADGIPESLKGWAVDMFPRAIFRRRSLKLIFTLTGGSGVTFFYMIQHPCFFVLGIAPKNVYKWYKIQVKSFEQSQRTQAYSRENMDCACETINNMINKTIKNRWLLVFQICFFSRYGFSDTLQETDIFSPKGTFEDDFPFPFLVGYLTSLVSPPGCHQPSQPGQKPSKADKAGAGFCISRRRED